MQDKKRTKILNKMLQLARVRVKYRGRSTFPMALSAEAVYSKYQ